ncbi:hypothetical protein F2P56_023562 [Juglans regia]|uniref:GDSL esterase/lipase At5g55050-like n=1 Tax=Juglans regia TaxID=51240 RepID=A0A833U5T0_JUGRE|nr:hypothetical protein F2P56_023562 [Juglans regia]
MAKKCRNIVPFSFSYFHFHSLAAVVIFMHVAEAQVLPPPIFIFGDSIADVGTNNYLNFTLARANFPHNGIDFLYSKALLIKSTGRFSNGFNTADQIVRLFGYEKSPQPFLQLLVRRQLSNMEKLQLGVNFASGAAGILDNTGLKKWKEVVSMKEQIQQFDMVRGNITEILGPTKTASMLSKSLFLIIVGTNDIFDYEDTYSYLSKPEFMSTLQFAFHNQLKIMYGLGARRFAIVSVAPIGCCPSQRSNVSGLCKEELNEFARMFYTKTKELLEGLSSELKEMKYSLGDAYKMTMSILKNSSRSASGFKEIKTACCGRGKYNGEKGCHFIYSPSLCPNRSEYLFWDYFHPTEYASELAARTLYSGGTNFMTPMNFSQLAVVDI